MSFIYTVVVSHYYFINKNFSIRIIPPISPFFRHLDILYKTTSHFLYNLYKKSADFSCF